MDKKVLVLASGNKGKIKEIKALMPEYEVKGYLELGDFGEIEENGTTFYENALIKAKTISEALNLPVLADDSGICVDYLDGAPGIYSARYSGKGDKENNKLILKNLEKVTDNNLRTAKFVCCMVLYFPNGEILTSLGETKGYIEREEIGVNGFGYDPIFHSIDLDKSMGIASDEEKNSVSHRFRAIEKIKKLLKEKDL